LSSKPSGSKPILSAQVVVFAAVGWAFISLLFFLLFSEFIPTQGFPKWYSVVTYVLENVAFLAAALLCFRNWRSPQIVSGRTVWLMIGLGMLSFFIGNLILAYWELGLGKTPDVSPGDFFFLLNYLFLGIGMFMAVMTRRLNLTIAQWLTTAAIGLLGIGIAYYIEAIAPDDLSMAPPPTPSAQWAMAASPALSRATPVAIAPVPPVLLTAPGAEESAAPEWAIATEAFLEPYADVVSTLYILGDILLLVMATMLLLAFWGGRFSTSWRFIAASAFSFYIADIWFNFAITSIPEYQTGALLEVFWIFSPVLVSIGAALEYDLSTRSRRASRRRS
jgi:hypothetical protein